MKYPLWSQDQFIDATSPGGLNPAAGVVSGSIASVGSAAWAQAGLLAPEAMTVAFSGMTATIGLPSPWGLLTSGGIVVRAHGTQTGADTQNYSVNFAPLVPGSGSLTAYLAATVTTIQQGPVPIPGPPPGHPAYDPTFVPAVGYTSTAYSVTLAAVSGGIDNVNTFELLRTTLTAGQTSLTAYNTAGQYRAPDRDAWPASTLTSGGTLVPGQAQTMQVFGASGVTVTLPPASGAGGLMFGFVNPLAVTGAVAATGSDLITGLGASGVSSVVMPASGSLMLWGDSSNATSGQWQVVGFSPNFLTRGQTFFTASGSFSWTAPNGVYSVKVRGWAAGGGGGGGSAGGSGAGAGGAGGYFENIYPTIPGTSGTVNIGGGGSGGNGLGTNGGSGGATSFWSYGSANGGAGGTGTTTGSPQIGGAGGTASAGSGGLSFTGQPGSNGQVPAGVNTGGTGGGAFGQGPNIGPLGGGTGLSGYLPGQGGNGAGGNYAGGQGANGFMIIDYNPD